MNESVCMDVYCGPKILSPCAHSNLKVIDDDDDDDDDDDGGDEFCCGVVAQQKCVNPSLYSVQLPEVFILAHLRHVVKSI